jgi:hypothetical protein
MEQIIHALFRAADVQRHVEFDCDKHIRLLCRRGFLEVVPERAEQEGGFFRRGVWPPPAEFLEGDGNVIGLAYYLQKWFRFGLQDWITRHARELESKEGVYSLEAWNERWIEGVAIHELSAHSSLSELMFNAESDYTNDYGQTLSAPMSE